MQKRMVIVNPVSAHGRTGRNWPRIAEALEQAGISFDWRFTSRSREATLLARDALRQGYKTVISVGGDGTLNEVVNGFFDPDRGCLINAKARLGLISSGTGRDFIRTVNYPQDIRAACQVLARGETKPVDIGRVSFRTPEGRMDTNFYINIAGMGMDSETVERVNRSSKVLGGKVSFLWGTVTALLRYRNREMTLEIDGMIRYHGEATMVVVANGQYFGGGMRVAPEARLDSGHFDIIIVNGMTKPEVIANLPSIYRGTHLSHPKVYMMRGTHVRAISRQRVLLQVDGEQPGLLDAEFNLLPDKLNLIC